MNTPGTRDLAIENSALIVIVVADVFFSDDLPAGRRSELVKVN
jgi:hypothetical protein